MTFNELKEFADLCEAVLSFPQTGYARNKKFIEPLFEKELSKGNIEKIRRRLVLIDALYSTNMSRRLYGIDQLAEDISCYSDKESSLKFKAVLNGEKDGWVKELFEKKYGKKKSNAQPAARCFSLISKYAYYLCDCNFPIYDSLVKYYFNDLLNEILHKPERCNLLPQYQEVEPERFLNCLRHLKELSRLSYGQIDSILWTYGKLQERSLSLIVAGDEYTSLVKEKWFRSKNWLSFQEIKRILETIIAKRRD